MMSFKWRMMLQEHFGSGNIQNIPQLVNSLREKGIISSDEAFRISSLSDNQTRKKEIVNAVQKLGVSERNLFLDELEKSGNQTPAKLLRGSGRCSLAYDAPFRLPDVQMEANDQRNEGENTWTDILTANKDMVKSFLCNSEEVISLLVENNVLAHDDARMIIQRENEEEKREMLIKKLIEVGDRGRYPFLQIMEQTNNEHLSMQLSHVKPKGEQHKYAKGYRGILDKCRTMLVELLHNDEAKIRRGLIDQGVIAETIKSAKLSKSPSKEMMNDLLNDIQKNGEKAFEAFKDILSIYEKQYALELLQKECKLQRFSADNLRPRDNEAKGNLQENMKFRILQQQSKLTSLLLKSVKDSKFASATQKLADLGVLKDIYILNSMEDEDAKIEAFIQMILDLCQVSLETVARVFFDHGMEDVSHILKSITSDVSQKREKLSQTWERDKEIKKGSPVQVKCDGVYVCGVVRWIGSLKNKTLSRQYAGIELDTDVPSGTDGTSNKECLFRCKPGRGVFVKLEKCIPLPKGIYGPHESATGRISTELFAEAAIPTSDRTIESSISKEKQSEFRKEMAFEAFTTYTIDSLIQHGFDTTKKLILLYGKDGEINKLNLVLAQKLLLEDYLDRKKGLFKMQPRKKTERCETDVWKQLPQIQTELPEINKMEPTFNYYPKKQEDEQSFEDLSTTTTTETVDVSFSKIAHCYTQPVENISPISDVAEIKHVHRETKNYSTDVEINTKVKVVIGSQELTGIVKWIGQLPDKTKTVAGIDMGSHVENGNDGKFKGQKLFTCAPGHGLFVPLKRCIKFAELSNTALEKGSRPISEPTSIANDKFPADFNLGCEVEVTYDHTICTGIIRWIGYFKDPHKLMAGIEMSKDVRGGSDGKFKGHQLFTCPSHRALFTHLTNCRRK